MRDSVTIQLHFYKLGVLLTVPKHISSLSVILCWSTYHTRGQALALVELAVRKGTGLYHRGGEMQISSPGRPGARACHFGPQGVAAESSAGTAGETATKLAQPRASLLFP